MGLLTISLIACLFMRFGEVRLARTVGGRTIARVIYPPAARYIFPNLLSGVVMPGVLPARGWYDAGENGRCDSTQQQGGPTSGHTSPFTCCSNELQAEGYTEDQARRLIEAAFFRNNHPVGRTRNEGTNVPWFHMQKMCRVASADKCNCQLESDWCKQPAVPPANNDNGRDCGQSDKSCIKRKLQNKYRLSEAAAEDAAKDLANNLALQPPTSAHGRLVDNKDYWSRTLLAQCAAALDCGCKKKFGCNENFWKNDDITYEGENIKGW